MYKYKVESIKVITGDTLDVVLDVGFGITYRQKVRLVDFDAPDPRSKDEREKLLGIKLKKFLESELENVKDVTIESQRWRRGKYGRVMGFLQVGGTSMNKKIISWLKQHNWAVTYTK